MPKPIRAGRLPVAFFATLAALAALTCQNSTSFHLLTTGQAALGTDALPTQVAFAELTALNVANHNTMLRQGLQASVLEHLHPYSVTLSVSEPATGQDLTFLRNLTVVVSAPNLPDKVVAEGEGFDAGTNSAGLQVQDVDLRAYARTKKMTTTLHVAGGATPPAALTLRLAVVLAAVVQQPQGACN